MSGDIAYQARLNVQEKERTYRLGPAALLIEHGDGAPPESVPWADIATVRLRYFPTRFQWNRFECLLSTRQGRKLKIGSAFYRGVAQFDDRGPAYRAFVTALCRHLADTNPAVRFVSGRPKWALFLEMGFFLAMAALLVAVLVALGIPGRSDLWLRLGLVVVSLPLLWLYVITNLPGKFDPRAIPAKLLPRA